MFLINDLLYRDDVDESSNKIYKINSDTITTKDASNLYKHGNNYSRTNRMQMSQGSTKAF